MAIGDDFTINYGTKKISHTSGTTVYTVQAFYSWLMDTFDEIAQMDDAVPMSASTPTVFSLINGWEMNADADFQYLNGGSVNDTTNNDAWANIYTLGTIESGTTMYIDQNGSLLTSFWSAGHIDILIKVKSGGVEIDSGLITIYARELSDEYDWFEIDLTGLGRNPVPMATGNDLNNQTAEGTISGWTDVTITFGSITRDLGDGGGLQPYDVEVDCGSRTSVSQVYERLKWACRRGASGTLDGINSYFYQSADGAYTPNKKAPFGNFAGGKFFGARGVWLKGVPSGDVKNLQLVDANGVVRDPPNVVTATVSGLVAGDRVAIFELTGVGGSINKAKYTSHNTLNVLGDNTLEVTTTIESDTPAAGYLRVLYDTGLEDIYTYTSFSGTTFSGVSPVLIRTYNNADTVYVPILDKQAASTSEYNTLVYSADIPVLVRVRKYGILPFEIEGTVGSTGLTQAAIRTVDSIVT